MGEEKQAVAVSLLNTLQNETGVGQGIRESTTGPSCGLVSNFKSR